MWRVIVAEDEPLLGATLRGLLGASGISVVGVARNGQDAVELCRQLHPEAVVMDLRMPVLDGVEATRRIMAECPTRVIVLTGVDAPGARRAALAAGAESYLLKPLTTEEMVRAIRGVADSA